MSEILSRLFISLQSVPYDKLKYEATIVQRRDLFDAVKRNSLARKMGPSHGGKNLISI